MLIRVNSTISTVAKDTSEPKVSSTKILNSLKVMLGNAPSLGRADAVGKMAKKNSTQRIGANDFRTIDKHESSPRKNCML